MGVSVSAPIARSARKELQLLPINAAARLLEKIETLALNARPASSKKLSGAKDLWRLRVGDYRVVYKVDDHRLMIDIVIITRSSRPSPRFYHSILSNCVS